MLDVRVVGVRADELDLNVDELERQLAGVVPAHPRARRVDGAARRRPSVAPADTILGAFARDFRTRIAEQEASGDTERAAELREALRLGMLLLDDPQRVTLA